MFRKYLINPLNKGRFDITDDQNALIDYFVKKSGDTMTGDLDFDNASINNVYSISFDLTNNDVAVEGTMNFNQDAKTLVFGLKNNFELEIGFQLLELCVNKTGSDIPKGRVVYINGGQGNRPTITLADNDVDLTSARTFGVTGELINDNGSGYVVVKGLLPDINTNSFSAGTQLYLGEDGNLINTKPQAPEHLVYVAKVISQGTNGVLYIDVQNGFELNELHDVKITNLQNGQIIAYNSSLGLWENITFNPAVVVGNTNTISLTQISGVLYGNVIPSGIIHNDLFGLQGGKPPTGVLPSGQYFHLSQTEYNIVQATSGSNTGNVTVIDTRTVDLTISGQVLQARVRPENITHNSFSEIQGGVSNEYFHLTNSELNVVKATSGVNTGDVSVVDTQSVNLTLSGQQLMADVIPSNINVKDLKGVNFVQPTTSGQLLTYSGLNNELVNITPMFPTFWGLLNQDPVGVATNGYANRNGDTYWYIPEERIQVYINRWRELNGGDRITTENDNSLETENNIYLQANFGQGDYGL